MRAMNREKWQATIDTAVGYIKQLKDNTGRLVVEGVRKTGFVGFIVCLRSASEHPVLRYLTTYKFSQDHLELFFSAVLVGGLITTLLRCHSRQPTRQRLLMRHSVQATGNCVTQDTTHVLSVLPDTTSVSDMHIIRKYDLVERRWFSVTMTTSMLQMSPRPRHTCLPPSTTLPGTLCAW